MRNAGTVLGDVGTGMFVAALVPLLGAMLAGCGDTECPGGGKPGSQRCLNGVTPQWCAVSGGSGSGDVPEPGDLFNTGSETATWESYPSCQPPSTCIMLPDSTAAQQAVCSLSKSPVDECAGTDPSDCFNGSPVSCTTGYPTVSTVVFCPNVCVKGICALSATPDPQCPGGAAQTQYCSATGPVACEDGFDLDPAVYGPRSYTPLDNPCAGSADAGSADDAATGL
jgi:hypothetical protein